MNNNYIYISAKLVNSFNYLPCDIYIKLEKNNKMIKVSQKNSHMDINLLNKFISNNQSLVIDKSDINAFSSTILDNFNNEFSCLDITKTESIYDILYRYQELLSLTFNQTMSMEINNSIKDTFYSFFVEKNILNSPLYSYLGFSQLLTNKALLRMMLTLYLAKQVSFIKEKAYQNINTVSFFCDISLVENPDYEKHHFSSAKMISQEKTLYNEDVYLGILHHHEYLDGSGLLKLEARRIHEYGNLVRFAEDYIESEYSMNIYSLDLYKKYNKNYVVALRKIIDK